MKKTPKYEQLALFGASENQGHFNSERWGLLDFFPASSKKVAQCCMKCLLRYEDEECPIAPCKPIERSDKQMGYYSIHQMPTR